MTMPTHEEYLSDAEVAERLGITRGFVWTCVKRGDLSPPSYLGKSARFTWSLVQADVARQQRMPKAVPYRPRPSRVKRLTMPPPPPAPKRRGRPRKATSGEAAPRTLAAKGE